MRITAKQSSTKTIADLLRAADHRWATTITYLKPGETEPTVRTIEIHQVRTASVKVRKGEVTGGDVILVAMCRLRGDERNFRISKVTAYTVHRIGYVLTRPAPTTYERPEPQPTDDVQALFYYELARDKDDADYRPRVRLAA